MIDGYRALVVAIMSQAVKDLRGRVPADRRDAAEYFYSPLFENHCEVIDVDPRNALAALDLSCG